jgi:hypothetical protein
MILFINCCDLLTSLLRNSLSQLAGQTQQQQMTARNKAAAVFRQSTIVSGDYAVELVYDVTFVQYVLRRTISTNSYKIFHLFA